jgi:ABC-2 type transport system ATP-binding protein
MDILKIKGMTKRFGKRTAVNSIDMTIRRGEVVGFLGSNGAGKTTTFKCILGLLRSQYTMREVFGLDFGSHSQEILGKMIYFPDRNIFYPHLNAVDNLSLYANYYDKTKDDIDRALELVELGDRKRDKVKTYSLGMTQRLGMARLVLISPRLVFMDEPFNGVDIVGVKFMRNFIAKINKENSTTFVISSHNLHELKVMCSRYILIKSGKIVNDVVHDDNMDLEKVYLESMGQL